MEISVYKEGKKNPVLEQIKSRAVYANTGLVDRVTEIIEQVRSGGDEALIHLTDLYDGIKLDPSNLRAGQEEIRSIASRADHATVEAFKQAITNVRNFHTHQLESGWEIELPDGVKVGQRILPISSVGLYVPGGRAAYPSSVVMNAVPAQVAGVPRIVVTTPPGTLEKVPEVAAVLHELGISEIYRVGGAQAIAALAFGTETITKVDKIVGPGNIFVAVAKKLIYGAVGIDSIAGPTEVVVLADETADARLIAADMLAQAEHDQEASAICITDSAEVARAVSDEIERQVELLERKEIAQASINHFGAIFVVDSLEAGCDLVNLIAPEHLELMTSDDDHMSSLIKNAGAIFYGKWSSEPVGDYFAGPNHVLPTVGTSRFSSPLGVYDFMKRQSVIKYTREAIQRNAKAISLMAEAEGLTAHKLAVLARLEE